MPQSFNWSITVKLNDRREDSENSNSCREQAAQNIRNVVESLRTTEDESSKYWCEGCRCYHTYTPVKTSPFDPDNTIFIMTVSVTSGKRSTDVRAFIAKHYPDVTVTLDRAQSWDGRPHNKIVLTGNHWVVNAWWWVVLFLRLRDNVRGVADNEDVDAYFMELMKESNSSNGDIWYNPSFDKENHIAALQVLLAGKERPCYLSNFAYGPVGMM